MPRQTAIAGPLVPSLDREGRAILHPGLKGAGGLCDHCRRSGGLGQAAVMGRAMEAIYLDELLCGVDTGAPGHIYGLAVGIDRSGSE